MQILKGQAQYETRQFDHLCQMLEQSVDRFGQRPAFCFRRYPKGPVMLKTYEEFREEVLALATYLLDQSGSERVALMGENGYEWAVSYHAVLQRNGVIVPLDAQLPQTEVLSLIERSQAELFICTPKFLETGLSALNALPQLKQVLILDPMWAGVEALELPEQGKVTRYTDAVQQGRRQLRRPAQMPTFPSIDPEATAMLIFTSGTTSHSKAVQLSHRNVCHNVQAIAGTLVVHEGERMLSVLPMHHTFENTVGLQYPLYCGATICFTDGLRYLAKNLAEWRINCMIGVPLLFESIFKRVKEGINKSGKAQLVEALLPIGRGLKMITARANRLLFSSVLKSLGGEIRLMVSGSAPIQPEVVRGYTDFGIEFLQGYGMTEHSPVITVCEGKHNAPGSVGFPLNGVEVAIDTPEKYRGAIGEIWVRSESVMKGYYENEEATREAIDADGWLHTGDLGYFDNRDCLHITGRCKNMIVLASGKKVFPEECEEVLNAIEGVKESFVWGQPAEEREHEVDLAALLELDLQALGQRLAQQHEELRDSLLALGRSTTIPESLKPLIRSDLQEQIQQACAKMPGFKKIKYFLYSTEPMIRTASLKIRRKPQEERIQAFLQASNQGLKSLNGSQLYEGPRQLD